jgi:hypothetical protein
MNNYTIDFINTLDNYKSIVSKENHQDVLVRDFMNHSFLHTIKKISRNMFLLLFLQLVVTLFLVLSGVSINEYNASIILIVQQWSIIYAILLISAFVREIYKTRKFLIDIKMKGSPYLEDVKEYYFNNEDVFEKMREDISVVDKKNQDKEILKKVDSKTLTIQDMFLIKEKLEGKYFYNPIYWFINSPVERLKIRRKLDIAKKKEIELSTRELREQFNKD